MATAAIQNAAPADFHAWHGLSAKLPGPIELTHGQRAELATLPPRYMAARLIEMARDDFMRRHPIVGQWGSLQGKAQGAAWKEHADAYIAAAIVEWRS